MKLNTPVKRRVGEMTRAIIRPAITNIWLVNDNARYLDLLAKI